MSEATLNPVADERQTVVIGNARFTLLTPAMIRMEWSADGTFEDRASQFVINRQLEPVPFEVSCSDDRWRLGTAELMVSYVDDGQPFHPGNLSVRRHDWSDKKSWSPGQPDTGNLLGTARTLDDISGATQLEPGILSRDGWAVVDDSARLVFDPDYETGWLTPRDGPGGLGEAAVDWYFFGYGRDYKRALRDFTRIAGRQPLPPRFVFGAWWSRYWAYTDEDLKRIVAEYDEHDVPLDVLVVDMDWHLEGWTGYTWNPECFPEPDRFLKWCHENNLRVTLNLHPAGGVHSHESMFEEFARRVGVDPDSTDHVPFDCADPKYVRAYFELLHHPLERQGVDFWWVDWQQGEDSALSGLDPLWQLNHLHWRDMATTEERTPRRPLIFSRWGGLGNHRYPIGFSGDTHSDWASLAYQPYFTATASNVGYGYWSHDIGGHYHGPVDAELYLRWIQYGVFSPVLRTHTTRHPDAERRIWKCPEVFDEAREAFWLRYRLIPYIYAAARHAHDSGIGLCRPLYYEWPGCEEAYRHPEQYMFGDDLLVTPVVTPVDPETGTASMDIWLPPGEWCDFFTADPLSGDRIVRREVFLNEIPVYVRAGAIVPFVQPTMRTEHIFNHIQMVRVFPGERGESSYYEDDGETVGYVRGECSVTRYRQTRPDAKHHRIDIDAVQGEYAGMPSERQYCLELMGFGPLDTIRVDGVAIGDFGGDDTQDGWMTEEVADWALIALAPRSIYTPLRIEIELA